MASSKSPQLTDFSIDILGRYMCNGLDEALHSIDKNAQRPDGSPQNDARPFNAIVIGGGSFGGVLAQHLLYSDKTNSHRILVLEAGRHALPEHFQEKWLWHRIVEKMQRVYEELMPAACSVAISPQIATLRALATAA